VAILRKELQIDRTLGEILQILSISLFEKEPIYQLLSDISLQDTISESPKQLMLNI
jgi:hypothetical protein